MKKGVLFVENSEKKKKFQNYEVCAKAKGEKIEKTTTKKELFSTSHKRARGARQEHRLQV